MFINTFDNFQCRLYLCIQPAYYFLRCEMIQAHFAKSADTKGIYPKLVEQKKCLL